MHFARSRQCRIGSAVDPRCKRRGSTYLLAAAFARKAKANRPTFSCATAAQYCGVTDGEASRRAARPRIASRSADSVTSGVPGSRRSAGRRVSA